MVSWQAEIDGKASYWGYGKVVSKWLQSADVEAMLLSQVEIFE